MAEQGEQFRWVNEMPSKAGTGLKHETFISPGMGIEVGYVIYLPKEYDNPDMSDARFPVVYYLHGGRPGSETKSITLAKDIHELMQSGKVPPAIYVFVNGGKVSHYDYDVWPGETTFVKELIPHIDQTYRTINDRSGRGLEGFSQGGRGTARIMFKYPELFISAGPMGGGHQHEKRIAENEGKESDELVFDIGNNTYDLAREYAAASDPPSVRILVVFGTKDFNYEANLDWTAHLESLGIDFERIILDDVPHNARLVYEKAGEEIMRFHADNFAQVTAG